MLKNTRKRLVSASVGLLLAASAIMPFTGTTRSKLPMQTDFAITAAAAQKITIDDLPSDYQYAADWIWENRIVKENSTGRRNTIFDQIIAGKGTINYVIKWQSHKTLTLEQRKQFATLVSTCINDWNNYLVGYENWPYEHIDVKIVGWAVIDENCILDRQADEIVYTDTIPYDSQYDTVPDPVNNPVPDKEPLAPSELSRFDHFFDTSYQYPGGLDKRFDMYLWGTQGFPSIGGCGGDWGQRLSDDAYINMLDGTGIHVLEHELGHGFGMTDFYGGEGESDGFPPGGFPGGSSLMMAGSSVSITDFDGWMLRYMWTKIKDEDGRFNIEEVPEPPTTDTPVVTTTTAAPEPVITTTTTNVTINQDAQKVPAEITPGETNSVWTLNSAKANAVELTFKGRAHGGSYGVLEYSESAADVLNWEGRFDETGEMKVLIELPGNQTNVTIHKHFAAVWDDELGDMKDMDIYLSQAMLIYNEPITTTTTANVPEKEPVYGDANLSGDVSITDAVIILSHSSNSEKTPLNDEAANLSDVFNRGDGIDALDALAVQKLLANVVNSLPESYMT